MLFREEYETDPDGRIKLSDKLDICKVIYIFYDAY